MQRDTRTRQRPVQTYTLVVHGTCANFLARRPWGGFDFRGRDEILVFQDNEGGVMDVCPNGHPVARGNSFCGVCGEALLVAPQRPDDTESQTLSEARSPRPGGGPLRLGRVPLAAVVVLLVAAAAFLIATNSKTAHVMSGVVTAPTCTSGYNLTGAQVEVRDENNKLIGTATTGSDLAAGVLSACVVMFKVQGLPDAKFYALRVGTHGAPDYTETDLTSRGWKISLNLGGALVPPAGSLCDDLGALQAVTEDTATFNNTPTTWQVHLSGALDQIGADVIALRMTGDRANASRIAGAVVALRPLATRSQYGFTATIMNTATQTAQASIMGLTADGCTTPVFPTYH